MIGLHYHQKQKKIQKNKKQLPFPRNNSSSIIIIGSALTSVAMAASTPNDLPSCRPSIDNLLRDSA